MYRKNEHTICAIYVKEIKISKKLQKSWKIFNFFKICKENVLFCEVTADLLCHAKSKIIEQMAQKKKAFLCKKSEVNCTKGFDKSAKKQRWKFSLTVFEVQFIQIKSGLIV